MTRDKSEKKVGKEQLLLEAARLGQFEKLDSILSQLRQLKAKKRTNPLSSLRKTFGLNNIRDPVTGFTCLHHASLNGHSECVRLLLDHGAKPNALDYKGSSALHLASWAGNLDVVRILLGSEQQPVSSLATTFNSIDLDQQQQQQASSEDQRQLMLVDVDLCNNDNQTPISLAAQFGHHEVVAVLLAHGANAAIRNSQLESPLDLACLNGRLETVDLLLRSTSPNYPAQPELQRPQASLFLQNHHLTPTSLHGNNSPANSSSSDSKQIQRRPSAGGGAWSSLLLRTKSFSRDIEHEDEADSTLAKRRNTLANGDVIEKLLEHSPLHYAARRGHLDVIRLLLYRYNANLLQVTTRGSVLHEVATNGYGASKHGEVLGLIFDYVRNTVAKENRGSYLDRLLNLKNAQTKNVFQVLNEINNRSANEIKRLIYELSERLTNEDSSQQVQQQQQQQQLVTNQTSNQPTTTRQLLTRQFSDSQQINSFLTMKRAANNNNHPLGQHLGSGTQTIDRSYQPKHKLEQRHPQMMQHQQQHQQQQHFQLYQPTMTRSYSNLTHVPANYNNQLDAFNQSATQQQQQQQQQNQFVAGYQNRRSKSRDFGSLLMEAKQMGHPVNIDPYGQSGPMKAQVWHPHPQQHQQQHQQQQQPIVRSQTDCSHLSNSSVLGQDLDRKTINRHYHVYDFEFYPPRLQQQQHQQTQPQQPAGMPSRPSHPEALVGPNSALRSSTRSNASMRVQQQQAQANFDNQPASADSRLSLNVDLSQQQAQQQQHHMDRFLGRHSKKIGVVAPSASMDHQKHEDSTQQKQPQQYPDPRLSLQQQQQQLRQVQSSCSLESHLSEPQLFDSARQAIMRDFDEMIGRELLNMGQSQSSSCSDNKSRSSTLTGIILDMDRYGERLTVSGTLNNDQPSRRLSSASSNSQAATPEPAKQIAGGPGTRQSVIYDLPSQAAAQLQMSNSEPSPSNQRMVTRRSQTIATDHIISQPLSAQPAAKNRPALTEPPKVRPPPPPVVAPPSSLSSPLRVTAPGCHQQFQLSSPASSDQLGLLKMASITSNSSSSSGSSSSIMRLAMSRKGVGNNAADLDSGVCTSNSPASLSHDSGDNSNQAADSTTFSSLPVNLTVQQKQRAIESQLSSSAAVVRHKNRKPPSELHLPAAAPASATQQTVGPPSPTTAQMCIEQALGTIEKSTHEMANQTCAPIAADDDDDADETRDLGYENCLDLQRRLRQVDCRTLRELLSEAIDEEEEEDEDDDDADYAESIEESRSSSGHLSQSSSTTDQEASSAQVQRRAAGEQAAASDKKREVLLRVVVDDKLVGGNEKSLGDDELDDGEENVFYINPIDLKNIVEKQIGRDDQQQKLTMTNAASLTDEDLCASVDKSSGLIRFTLKKRRMRSEDECQSSLGSTSCNSLHGQPTKHDTNKKTKFNESPEKRVEQVATSDSTVSLESPIVSSTSRVRLDEVLQLRQWFETNLVGLADYIDKFTQQGFDDLQFLNHPDLINDKTLKLIGIDEESHRLLIVDRIANELPLVDFQAILRSTNDASCKSICDLLKLDSLPCLEEESCGNESELVACLRKESEKLPVGHRVRLLGALNILEANQASSEQKLSKQSSTESGETEIMDTSLISATSSSSKESIKSIVSKPPVQPVQVQEETRPVVHEQQGSAIPQVVQAKEESVVVKAKELKEETQPEEEQEKENIRPRATTTKLWSSNRTSLVSEAARKLEMAAAAANQTNSYRAPPPRPTPPVAAVRKSTVAKLTGAQSNEDTIAIRERKTSLPVKAPICWPPKANQSQEQTACIAPVKEDSSTLDETLQQTKTTNGVNRLSYQRMLFEEKSKAAAMSNNSNANTNTKTRPKPAPPAKPAKLVVGGSHKFGTDLNNKL